MADSARPVSGGIVHADMGDEPGIGKGAMRLLVFAIAGAIVMPWVAYRSLNRYDMLRMPVTSAAAGAAVSPRMSSERRPKRSRKPRQWR